jgi:predicted nucleic acid-binding protein
MGFASVKISQALSGVKRLGIETSPFIYLVEKNPAYLDRIQAIFQYVSKGRIQGITSSITLAEVLTMPLKMKQQQYVDAYRRMLLNTDNIKTQPVTTAVAERAAQLRASYGLRTPDALHIATAIEYRCDAFLTNDLQLMRVNEIRVLVLDKLATD